MKVSSTDEMRELDRTAIEKYGIIEDLLMENAGLAVCAAIREHIDEREGGALGFGSGGVRGRKFVIFCGIGNNGGDGLVAARKLHSDGGLVKIFILGDVAKYRGGAKRNLEIVERLPIPIVRIESTGALDAVRTDAFHCDVVIDAIFGTGLVRNVEGLYHDAIELINRSRRRRFVVSIDIPSGVNGDTGQVMGIAVRADLTVAFGLPKLGNLLYPGYDLCGRLYVTHISFPPELHNADSLKIEINCPPRLPPRPPDAHKGLFGDVLFIAGAASYLGAPFFAALSFMKAGGGYARLASPRSIAPFIAVNGSELVFVPQKETATGSIALESKPALLELARKCDMVVLGPGLSLEDETRQLTRELTREIETPLLLDGDAITAVCEDLQAVKARTAPTVITPHLGEMARIVRTDKKEIDRDKPAALRNATRELNAHIVLKGSHSLIGRPDGRIFVNMSGNSGMATAGSGDVLTGTIAAMFGLGLAIPDAVQKGTFLHGFAGDLAARARGPDGMTARDILEHLPCALMTERAGTDPEYLAALAGVKLI